jgi:hypothetical protein
MAVLRLVLSWHRDCWKRPRHSSTYWWFDINSVEHSMLDREKIVAVLKKRFAGAGNDQIAAAANAIVGLDDEWEEVTTSTLSPCSDSCYLARAAEEAWRFKVLRKRSDD